MEGPRQRFPGKSKPESSDKRAGLDEDEAVKRASSGWIGTFFIALLATIVILVLILFLIPSPIKPAEIPGLPEAPALEGPLAPNQVLTYAEKLYRNQLVGPESIVVDGDYIYTGTADGWVNVIHAGMVKKLVRFGKEPCGGIENENTCGRPLGMRLRKDGLLIVLDAYYGLFEVNVVTGDYKTLFSSSTPVNGKRCKLLNDLDIGPDGTIYFTDSSTRYSRNQFIYLIFDGAGTGRLLSYSPATKEVSQLVDGLVFANGVQLNKDKTAVLVVETVKARVLQYNLKTKKVSVWAENLPGYPDNIRYCKTSGTYWVGMAVTRHRDKFDSFSFLFARPWLRAIAAKIFTVQVMDTLKPLISRNPAAMAIEMDNSGSIIGSIQDTNGDVILGVSEVESSNGVLYFGSYNSNYIGRLYTKKVPGH